jgi:hypothetical protein
VSRRASLPGAEELFRRTTGEAKPQPARRNDEQEQVSKSTKLQVAPPAEAAAPAPAPAPAKKAPKHDEKVTFYCTRDDLTGLEKARLELRSEHGVAADRGRIVRAALAYILEDFEARGGDSVLLRKLTD